MRPVFALVTLLVCFSLPVHAELLNLDEQTVWMLEESYWIYVKANDTQSYAGLWDDRFIGWPGFSPIPLGKENIADWIAPLHADPDLVHDYELTRHAVRSFGEVVVTHYLVQQFFRSAATGEIVGDIGTARITHTWLRQDHTWQIIAGMSGSLVAGQSER